MTRPTPALLARSLAATLLLALCAPAPAGTPAPLALSPASAKVTAGGTVTFQASGGAGGYAYTLKVNASGGAIDPRSGQYTAGATAGADTVAVTDAAGVTRAAQVQVAESGVDENLGGHR